MIAMGRPAWGFIERTLTWSAATLRYRGEVAQPVNADEPMVPPRAPSFSSSNRDRDVGPPGRQSRPPARPLGGTEIRATLGSGFSLTSMLGLRRPSRATLGCRGEVAQLVEHTAENRGVAGSSPALATSMTRPFCMAVVLAALFAAVASSASAGSDESIVVTRNSQSLPGGCTTADVAGLVRELFDAFNAGDWDVVDEIFASAGAAPPSFALFSLDRDVVIYDRERLIPYLAEVRSRGERLRLVAVRAAPGHRSMVGLNFALDRAEGIAGGKGMLDCVSGRIWQGALGTPTPGAPPVPCPQPSGWSPSGPILACTGGPNARAISADLKVSASSARLPRRCSSPVALEKLSSALSSFNAGDEDLFAKHFVTTAAFYPYARTQSRIVGRAAIAHFVSARYGRGDGWTATALQAPMRASVSDSRRVAVYRVGLQLAGPGRPTVTSSAKVSFDCRSGLIRSWIGPVTEAPPLLAAGQP